MLQLKTTKEDVGSLVTDIIRIFVDARHHIPRHRSQMLFRRLFNVVGVHDYLWQLPAIIVESAIRTRSLTEDESVTKQSAYDAKVSLDDDTTARKLIVLEKDFDFASLVYEAFEVNVQLDAIACFTSFLIQLVDVQQTHLQLSAKVRPKVRLSGTPTDVLNLEGLSSQQIRLLQFHCTKGLAVLVSRKALLAAVSAAPVNYQNNLKQLLSFTQAYLVCVAKLESSLQSAASHSKFWKTLMIQVYVVVDKVACLLPLDLFLSMAANILSDDATAVHHRTLEFIGVKLQQLQHQNIDNGEVCKVLLSLQVKSLYILIYRVNSSYMLILVVIYIHIYIFIS